MEDFKHFNNKNIEDFNSEIEFDSEILARSNIDFNSNKEKFIKNKKVIYFINIKNKSQIFFNILVIGPSDSGKTTFIENISKKLDKRFKLNVVNSFSKSTTSNDNLNENKNEINENFIEQPNLRRKKSHIKTSIGNS